MTNTITTLIRSGKTPNRGFDFTITKRIGKYDVDFLLVATHPTDSDIRYEHVARTKYAANKRLKEMYL